MDQTQSYALGAFLIAVVLLCLHWLFNNAYVRWIPRTVEHVEEHPVLDFSWENVCACCGQVRGVEWLPNKKDRYAYAWVCQECSR
jgi:hypothetical protein